MTLLGWSVPDGMGEIFTIKESANVFNFERVNKAGAKFDWEKLKWLNSQVIHNSSSKLILNEVKPLFENEGWQLPGMEWCIDLIELIKPSLILLTDSIEQSRFFFEEPLLKDDASKQLEVEGAKESLKVLLEQLKQSQKGGLSLDRAKELITETARAGNFKKGLIMKSLRAALLGCLKGPDLLTSWVLLSRVNKDITRIKRSL